MRKLNLLVLAWLAVAALNVEARADSPQYYWITENDVVLWTSSTEPNPVTATLDPNGNIWSYGPPEAARQWRPLLEEIARKYPQPLTPLKEEAELWRFVLTKLRNDYDKVTWAEKSEPSVEVYFVPKPPDARGEALNLVIFSRLDPSQRKEVQFTRPPGGKWSKGNKDIDINALFGISSVSLKMRQVFGLGENKALPGSPAAWEAFWDEWIEDNRNDLNAGRPYKPTTYVDDKGKPRWLLVEQLALGVDTPTLSRVMPAAPPDIADAVVAHPTPTPGGGWFSFDRDDLPSRLWVILLALTVVAGLVFTVAFSQRARQAVLGVFSLPFRAVASLRAARPKSTETPGLSVDELGLIHACVLDRHRQDAAKRGASPDPLVNALDWLHHEYVAAATAAGVLSAAETQRKEIVKFFIKEKFGEDADEAKLKRWVEFGRQFEEAASKVTRLTIPEDVQKSMGNGLKNDQGSPGDWAAKWALAINAYHNTLKDTRSSYITLQSQVEQTKTAHTAALMKLEKDLKQSGSERHDAIVKEKREVEKSLETVNGELANSKRTVTELEGKVGRLEADLETVRGEKKATLDSSAVLSGRAEKLKEVKILSLKLRLLLQGYYSVKKQEELRPVALLAALVNFSLCQLCLSIMDGRETLSDGAAHNLLRLAEHFEQSSGEKSRDVRDDLARIAPNSEAVLKRMKESDFITGRLDDPLFKGFLSTLKADTGKSPSEFVIDTDKENTKLVRVTL